MYYTEHVAKLIAKTIGGKVVYKKGNGGFVQVTLALNGTIDDLSLPSKFKEIRKVCLMAHKKYLIKHLKAHPELEELYTINDINDLYIKSKNKFHNYQLKVCDGSSSHYSSEFIILSDCVHKYLGFVIPELSVVIACQEFYTERWKNYRTTIVCFQVEISNYIVNIIENWLDDKGISDNFYRI